MISTAIVFWGLLLSTLTPLAHSYVPPSFYVVRMLARKHAPFEDAEIKSRVTFYKKNGDYLKSITETLTSANSDNVNIRLADETGNEIIHHNRKVSSPTSIKAGELGRPLPYDLLMVRDGASIFDHFKALGLQLTTEANLYSEKQGDLPYKPEDSVYLSRLENKIAVVVTGPGTQIWVEKDSFLPLKASLFAGMEKSQYSSNLEFRFSGYQIHKNYLYPKTMQVFKDGNLWVKVEAQDVKLGSNEHSKEKHRVNSDADVSSELKESIELYLKWIR